MTDPFGALLATSGVPRDAALLVHGAFAGLSRQGYRAEAAIESWLERLERGALLMPTMSWRTVTPANPVFDERATPSHTGVLTELFRVEHADARSLHPTHSVAGKGPLAAGLLAGHHLGNTPVPATSPYGLMRDVPAYVLLLGVGLECCTAIHHAEELVAPDLYLVPEVEHYTLRARDGRELHRPLRRHRRLARDFGRFEPALAATGMHGGDIGGVPWRLFRLADLMRVVFAALIADPRATLE